MNYFINIPKSIEFEEILRMYLNSEYSVSIKFNKPPYEKCQNTPKKSSFFGTSLTNLEYIVCDDLGTSIPKILWDLGTIIENNLDAEGIFRKSGSCPRQVQVQKSINKFGFVPTNITFNVFDACCLFKHFFAKLPEPIFPTFLWHTFIKVYRAISFTNESISNEWVKHDKEHTISDENSTTAIGTNPSNNTQSHRRLEDALLVTFLFLPFQNINVLRYTFNLLAKVTAHADRNKMHAENLATLMTPNFLHDVSSLSWKEFIPWIKIITLYTANADRLGWLPARLTLQYSKLESLVMNERLAASNYGLNDEDGQLKTSETSDSPYTIPSDLLKAATTYNTYPNTPKNQIMIQSKDRNVDQNQDSLKFAAHVCDKSGGAGKTTKFQDRLMGATKKGGTSISATDKAAAFAFEAPPAFGPTVYPTIRANLQFHKAFNSHRGVKKHRRSGSLVNGLKHGLKKVGGFDNVGSSDIGENKIPSAPNLADPEQDEDENAKFSTKNSKHLRKMNDHTHFVSTQSPKLALTPTSYEPLYSALTAGVNSTSRKSMRMKVGKGNCLSEEYLKGTYNSDPRQIFKSAPNNEFPFRSTQKLSTSAYKKEGDNGCQGHKNYHHRHKRMLPKGVTGVRKLFFKLAYMDKVKRKSASHHALNMSVEHSLNANQNISSQMSLIKLPCDLLLDDINLTAKGATNNSCYGDEVNQSSLKHTYYRSSDIKKHQYTEFSDISKELCGSPTSFFKDLTQFFENQASEEASTQLSAPVPTKLRRSSALRQSKLDLANLSKCNLVIQKRGPCASAAADDDKRLGIDEIWETGYHDDSVLNLTAFGNFNKLASETGHRKSLSCSYLPNFASGSNFGNESFLSPEQTFSSIDPVTHNESTVTAYNMCIIVTRRPTLERYAGDKDLVKDKFCIDSIINESVALNEKDIPNAHVRENFKTCSRTPDTILAPTENPSKRNKVMNDAKHQNFYRSNKNVFQSSQDRQQTVTHLENTADTIISVSPASMAAKNLLKLSIKNDKQDLNEKLLHSIEATCIKNVCDERMPAFTQAYRPNSLKSDFSSSLVKLLKTDITLTNSTQAKSTMMTHHSSFTNDSTHSYSSSDTNNPEFHILPLTNDLSAKKFKTEKVVALHHTNPNIKRKESAPHLQLKHSTNKVSKTVMAIKDVCSLNETCRVRYDSINNNCRPNPKAINNFYKHNNQNYNINTMFNNNTSPELENSPFSVRSNPISSVAKQIEKYNRMIKYNDEVRQRNKQNLVTCDKKCGSQQNTLQRGNHHQPSTEKSCNGINYENSSLSQSCECQNEPMSDAANFLSPSLASVNIVTTIKRRNRDSMKPTSMYAHHLT